MDDKNKSDNLKRYESERELMNIANRRSTTHHNYLYSPKSYLGTVKYLRVRQSETKE